DLGEALRLNCIGLMALSFSIYIRLPKFKNSNSPLLYFNIKNLFLTYFVFVMLERLAYGLGQFGGFFQLLLKLSVLKWAILFLIIYDGLTNKRLHFLIIIGLEILLNILSYFST